MRSHRLCVPVLYAQYFYLFFQLITFHSRFVHFNFNIRVQRMSVFLLIFLFIFSFFISSLSHYKHKNNHAHNICNIFWFEFLIESKRNILKKQNELGAYKFPCFFNCQINLNPYCMSHENVIDFNTIFVLQLMLEQMHTNKETFEGRCIDQRLNSIVI